MKTKEQKALLKKCRHRAEIPVTIVAIVLTVAVAVLIVFLFGSVGKNQQAEEILIEQFEYEQTDIDFAVKCGKYLLTATVAARWIPIVKSIYNRVMCYSADRLTAELISREECITVFLERYMQSTYESERRDEYIKRLKDQKLTFTERLSAALYNLTQDTPSYPDRIRALMDERNHGRVV